MRGPLVTVLLPGIALLLTMTHVASAQVPVRVRGAIAKVSGQTLTVMSRDNSTVEVRLANNYTVTGVVPATLQDIKQDAFVGTAALPKGDGTFVAQEVVIFPESARGTGEGHYPWDLSPVSTMTNATVDAMVERVDGPVLTLKHKGGSVTVAVPKDVPIVTFAPGEKAMLQPGAHVFIPAEQQADGTVTAARVLVGKDGLVPPM
jgi:1-acyl-sn-glycerol-3-phosphate acyltransferase